MEIARLLICYFNFLLLGSILRGVVQMQSALPLDAQTHSLRPRKFISRSLYPIFSPLTMEAVGGFPSCASVMSMPLGYLMLVPPQGQAHARSVLPSPYCSTPRVCKQTSMNTHTHKHLCTHSNIQMYSCIHVLTLPALTHT